MKDWLLAGEFSTKTGLSKKALRLYDENGLLVSHTRGENNYRYYTVAQIARAQRILEYKDLGFSLDQIKFILSQDGDSSFAEIVDKQLQLALKESSEVNRRLAKLQSLQSSLKTKNVLTDEQRGTFMTGLFESTISNLKRQGYAGKDFEQYLDTELASLPAEKQELISELKSLFAEAKVHNVLLGPGRMNSAASLILLGEGYTKFNPLSLGLLAETFTQSKMMMIDVEYSNCRAVAKKCEEISRKLNFEVVAFKNPLLDIYKKIQNQVGEIAFDNFSDSDPRILSVVKNTGRKGLYGVDWNPNYRAFQDSSPSYKQDFSYNDAELDSLFGDYEFSSVADYIHQMALFRFFGRQDLKDYRTNSRKILAPELEETRGLLLYREDWLKIYMREAQCDFFVADELLNKLRSLVEDGTIAKSHEPLLNEIINVELRSLVFNAVSGLHSKSNQTATWWHFKRTAILKLLWKDIYLKSLADWESEHKMIWQEFGFKFDGGYHLKASTEPV